MTTASGRDSNIDGEQTGEEVLVEELEETAKAQEALKG